METTTPAKNAAPRRIGQERRAIAFLMNLSEAEDLVPQTSWTPGHDHIREFRTGSGPPLAVGQAYGLQDNDADIKRKSTARFRVIEPVSELLAAGYPPYVEDEESCYGTDGNGRVQNILYDFGGPRNDKHDSDRGLRLVDPTKSDYGLSAKDYAVFQRIKKKVEPERERESPSVAVSGKKPS